MAEEERGAAHRVVHVLVAVDVPLAGALGPLDVDGEGRHVAAVVRDTAGQESDRVLEELIRPSAAGPH